MKHVLTVPAEAALLDLNPAWRKWVASRPAHIQEAIRRFPPGTHGYVLGERVWVMGWGEKTPPPGVTPTLDHVGLIFSTVNPFADYDAAADEKHVRRACAAHFAPEEEG
jgi:hypothetical protein